MSRPILYFWSESCPARTVLLFIRYLNLDVEIYHCSFEEWIAPEFLKINPARKIPVLIDGDFKLCESTAICQYLYEKSGSNKPLNGEGLEGRAIVNEMILYNIGTLFQKIYQLGKPLYGGSKIVKQWKKDAVIHEFEVLDKLLGRFKFAAADYPTIADFGLITSVTWLQAIDFETQNYPNITKWLKNCESLPGMDENEQGSIAYGKLIKGMAPDQFKN